MKKRVLFIAVAIIMAVTISAQNSKAVSKINLLGAGYGLEYFFSPNISWHNEAGISYWEKITDAVENKSTYAGVVALNPYFSSSVRYYFSPMHTLKDGKTEIGWRLSATYTGLYTQSDFLNFSGKNINRIGLMAGTSICFSKNQYFELDLGPGYEFDAFRGDKFNLIGKIGYGFKF